MTIGRTLEEPIAIHALPRAEALARARRDPAAPRPLGGRAREVSAPDLRRAGAARRRRARAADAPRDHRRRRADRRPRRVGAGRAPQPAARPAARVRAHLSARQPQPQRDPPRHRAHRRDVSRPDRRGCRRRAISSRRPPTLFRRAAVDEPGRRPASGACSRSCCRARFRAP